MEKETLCWYCEKYSNCSWSRKFKPIENWVAKYSKTTDSYIVLKCPQFKDDSRCQTCVEFNNNFLISSKDYPSYCPKSTLAKEIPVSAQTCKNFKEIENE